MDLTFDIWMDKWTACNIFGSTGGILNIVSAVGEIKCTERESYQKTKPDWGMVCTIKFILM